MKILKDFFGVSLIYFNRFVIRSIIIQLNVVIFDNKISYI